MAQRNVAWTLAGLVAVGASVVAGVTIWLLLTEPLTVANVVSSRDLVPLAQAVVGALYEALLGLVRYL